MLAVSLDRKSTRLNSSHTLISYAVFCLKKKTAAEEVDRQPGHGPVVEPGDGAGEVGRRHVHVPVLGPGERARKLALSSFFLKKRRPPESTPFPCAPLFQ